MVNFKNNEGVSIEVSEVKELLPYTMKYRIISIECFGFDHLRSWASKAYDEMEGEVTIPKWDYLFLTGFIPAVSDMGEVINLEYEINVGFDDGRLFNAMYNAVIVALYQALHIETPSDFLRFSRTFGNVFNILPRSAFSEELLEEFKSACECFTSWGIDPDLYLEEVLF